MNRSGDRMLGKAYSSYHGRFHSRMAGTDVKVFGNVRVSMNSVSAGHVQLGKPAGSLREERAYLKNLSDND